MKNVIIDLLKLWVELDYEQQEKLSECLKELICKLDTTINCPSNWHGLAEEIIENIRENKIDIEDFKDNLVDIDYLLYDCSH